MDRGSIQREGLINRISRSAIRRELKERERELLVHNADVEMNYTRSGQIDANSLNRKPKKELLRRNSGQFSDLAVAEAAGDVEIIVNLILELGIAGLVEKDLESAGGRINRESGDVLGEEADGEAVKVEMVVDGGWVRSGHERRGEEEEEEEERGREREDHGDGGNWRRRRRILRNGF